MTTIVVTHEDNQVDQFTFDATDRVITIGRRSSNDVCIPNLSVSGMHARITIDGNSASIEDNSSTNGTYVNGRLISRQLLNGQDEIVIGQSTVVVQLSPQQNTQSSAAPEDKTVTSAQSAVNDEQVVNEQDYAHEDYAQEQAEPPVLNAASDIDNDVDTDFDINAVKNDKDLDDDFDFDQSFENDVLNDDLPLKTPDLRSDQFDDRPMSLSEKAKLALGRESAQPRSNLNGVAAGAGVAAASSAAAAASRAFARDSDVAVAEAPTQTVAKQSSTEIPHPLDDIEHPVAERVVEPLAEPTEIEVTDDDAHIAKPAGAVIEIQNGAKSGQVLPIDKPVTTLGRPGIQIAAIMRKPDGYFLMHIESDESVDMPTLNRDTIGDDPVMLQSGDRLNVAGIDVEFMLS